MVFFLLFSQCLCLLISCDQPITLNFILLPTDGVSEWKSVNRLPRCSIRQALTHYLDITTPPSQKLVAQLALVAQNNKEQEQLKDLSKVQKMPNVHQIRLH